MDLIISVYENIGGVWKLCKSSSIPFSSLSGWEGWSDDIGYMERAFDFARRFPDHVIKIHDPISKFDHRWRTGRLAGCPTVKYLKVAASQ